MRLSQASEIQRINLKDIFWKIKLFHRFIIMNKVCKSNIWKTFVENDHYM